MKLIEVKPDFVKLRCSCGCETHYIASKKGRFEERYVFRCINCGATYTKPFKQLSILEDDE